MFPKVETMQVSSELVLNNKSTEDKRALKSHLYQLELGEKCSDQQWGS